MPSMATIADERGNEAIINTISNEWTELLSRTIATKMGGIALMALYSMDGKTAKKATLAGMISHSLRIGRTPSSQNFGE
jgi:DUF917 family protein